MTAIAALVHNGKVFMAGDSAGVGGYSIRPRKDTKVFRLGEFLIGYTDSFRMGQLLRFHLTLPNAEPHQDAFEYMVKVFMPAVRELLKQNGYAKVENGVERIGHFLVGWRGRIFMVHDDLQVAESFHEFEACGCGDELLLGALAAIRLSGTPTDPKDQLRRALGIAEQFCAGVCAPFVFEEEQ